MLPGDYGASTHRDNTIYVHVLRWPGDKLVLPAIPIKIINAKVLTGGPTKLAQTSKEIELSVPAEARSEIDTIIALQLASSADALQPVKNSDSSNKRGR